NCIAIGASAVSLPPLDAVQLHMIHIGLSTLISLFPAAAETMPEAAAYNRAMVSHVVNVRDFQLTHTVLNGRVGEPFWDRARAMELPASLRTRLRIFAARGRVLLNEDESFQPHNWTQILLGHGLMPSDHDPAVDAVPAGDQMARVQGLLTRIAGEVKAMPALDPEFGAV
ncbi:MAG: tryptophan 7-halogenase, partial [Brevundimonas sp.]